MLVLVLLLDAAGACEMSPCIHASLSRARHSAVAVAAAPRSSLSPF